MKNKMKNKKRKMKNKMNFLMSKSLLVSVLLFSNITYLYSQKNYFGNQDKANAKVDGFFASTFGKNIAVALQLGLSIGGILFCIPILINLMKNIADTNERQGGGEDEMSEKKKLIINALFKMGVILALGFGGTGLIGLLTPS